MENTSLNIYQRMIAVQKAVKTVLKNETVKMSENDKGYKAVTHDDVAAVLHLPLAEAGIVLLPDIEKYSTSSFDKVNQWGKTVTWYRTDIDITCKWINADKPEDFITSKGAAFALDTSDKSFAKAYSLAMKIVLLKVHLLESKDGEENRPFDEHNTPDKQASKQQAQQYQQQNRNQQASTKTKQAHAAKNNAPMQKALDQAAQTKPKNHAPGAENPPDAKSDDLNTALGPPMTTLEKIYAITDERGYTEQQSKDMIMRCLGALKPSTTWTVEEQEAVYKYLTITTK
jgi:hypothetical protein